MTQSTESLHLIIINEISTLLVDEFQNKLTLYDWNWVFLPPANEP